MQKTVIFDFDGTIADSIPKNPDILRVFNQIATEENFKNITLKEIEALRDVGLYESVKILKIPIYKIPFLAKRIRDVVKADATISRPVKGIPDILNTLKQNGYNLGIMTSNKKETVEKFLNKHNLKIFNFIYSKSNLFGKDKALKSLLKNEKIDPKSAIYVGDEIRDIQATKKINLPIVSVTWGYNSKKGLLNFNPEFVIDQPRDLIVVLASFFTKRN